jgi:folate-binding protein YgfZ
MAADDNHAMNTALTVSTPGAPHGALHLTDWGVIRAQGEDARKFLHGQLTQDVEHLPAGSARLAGYCSAKGRLLATLVIWSRSADDLLLACSADLLPAVLKRLSMFVMRAKCRLSDASAELPLWGLVGPLTGAELPTAPWQVTDLPAGAWIRLPDAVSTGGTTTARYLGAGVAAPEAPALDPATWAGLEVQSGVARVVAATAEQFVPQMVNLELVGGVNFQKGCYPGQEIVARSQYRGTLKRRAYVVEAAADLAPGQEVFHSADAEQPAGMVVLAGRAPGGAAVGLVELKIAALDSGSLHAGSAGGPLLTPSTLPYALPALAA